MGRYDDEISVDVLLGKTLSEIVYNGSDAITFKTVEGESYLMYHEQDCCEGVSVEDINGDLQDLVGNPILQAEEVVSNEDPEDYNGEGHDYSFTWTFYKFATVKGYVTIRWLGVSNGYYSESVSFIKQN